MIKTNKVVLITSPVLIGEAKFIYKSFFPDGEILVWNRGDDSVRYQIYSELLSGNFSLGISFYNDYIFSKEEIASIDCLVNIHPALPHLPGRGYDILPLLKGDKEYGLTFHFVSERIDSGEIIEVVSEGITFGTTHQNLRSMNQKLSLKFLKKFLEEYKEIGDDIKETLRNRSQILGAKWTGQLMNSNDLDKFLYGYYSDESKSQIL